MNILSILESLIPVGLQIASKVQALHSGSSVETKTQIASDFLGIATQAATAVLPPDQAADATAAGTAAQTVLAATVAALHGASTT